MGGKGWYLQPKIIKRNKRQKKKEEEEEDYICPIYVTVQLFLLPLPQLARNLRSLGTECRFSLDKDAP